MAIATGTALAIAATASLGGGVVGALSNASAADRAKALSDESVQQWLKLNVPDIESQKLNLEKFIQTGELAPELAPVFKLADTELAKYQNDPKVKEARMRALSALEEQGYGGEGVADAASRESALIDAAAQAKGEQDAITGSLARRGQLGSGLELESRMMAQQGAADRSAKTSLDLETARRQRALNAIMGAGDLAGDIENDNFAQAKALADSRDLISKFNTMNLQNVTNDNVNRTNDANKYNLDVKQDVANKNTVLNNFQQQYNKELAQKKFDNDATKIAGITNQNTNAANNITKQGQNTADMWAQLAKGAGTIGAASTLGKSKYNLGTGDYSGLSEEELKARGLA